MDFEIQKRKVFQWIVQIGHLCLQVLWHFLQFTVSMWYYAVHIVNTVESYIISSGLLKRYEDLNIGGLRYLALVLESEDAHETSKVIQLLQWLEAIGVKNVCLYDAEGILKKSKERILRNLNHVTPFEHNDDQKESLFYQKHINLEFASLSDGKEAVTKAANLLFQKYMKLGDLSGKHEEIIFTEANMSEALRNVGCESSEPELLLVYGPARCHLGFPAWRLRYTEIIHMGPLKFMRYGSLIKAIYKFTRVRQNFGS